jgi:uncharacterized protein GlcG (DUF336 family)
MKNHSSITHVPFLAALLIASPVSHAATTPPPLNAQSASQIIDGCVAHAMKKSQSHAIAVYDSGGHPVALLRMDGNPAGTTEFAMQKAEAVAYWQFSTQEMQTVTKSTPGFANAPHVVAVPGGVPIYTVDGHRFIGAIGVSGEAPQDDAACAEAGVKAAGFASARKMAD